MFCGVSGALYWLLVTVSRGLGFVVLWVELRLWVYVVMTGVLVWFGVYACDLALVLTRAGWWVDALMWFGFPRYFVLVWGGII